MEGERRGGPVKDTVTHFERHGKTPTSLGKGMSCKWGKWCSGIHLLIREGHMQVLASVLKLAITVSEKMPATPRRHVTYTSCFGLLMPQVAGLRKSAILWLRLCSGIKLRIREGHMPILASVPKLAITVSDKMLAGPRRHLLMPQVAVLPTSAIAACEICTDPQKSCVCSGILMPVAA